MTDLTRLSAFDAAKRIASGSLTSVSLVQAYLDRIAEREPSVRAWQHLDPSQAIAAAEACDKSPARGPLHGVPIGVKDIMDTADMPTTYGSRAYEGFRPRADAAVSSELDELAHQRRADFVKSPDDQPVPSV